MINNLISHIANDAGFGLPLRDGFLRSDIVETDKEYVLRVDAPGVAKDRLDVQFERGVLSVTATHAAPTAKAGADERFHLAERHQGKSCRRFRLPDGITKEDVSASLADGVLTLTVGKPDREARARENAILIN